MGSERSKVIPIWQPVGFSTHQVAKNVGRLFGTKGTHTGTLDPLAQGVIIVLTGDERFNKNKYSDFVKGYEFELFFGLSTDSFDGMGFITSAAFDKVLKKSEKLNEQLESTVKNFIGSYTQKVPLYSAIKYRGRRLFEWAHMGEKIDNIPQKQGKIYKLDLLNIGEKNFKNLIEENILSRLNKIVGEFRQEKIIKQWESYLAEVNPKTILRCAKIYVEMSRGLYVRSLARDICVSIDTPGFVADLIRIKNGPYTKEHCKSLENLFGFNFNRNDLVSRFKSSF